MEYWEVCNACGDRTGQIRPKGAFSGPVNITRRWKHGLKIAGAKF